MTDKKVLLKDNAGNSLFPKTKAEIVINNNGDNLGGVESGAQVNKIEKIKLNGVELSIVSKEVDITLPSAAQYSVTKLATAESGYAATYQLTKDNAAVGASINIPKDLVVQSGEVKECTTAGSPVADYKKGDKYIDLLLANADDQHIYILVSDLVDVYTAGSGITISGNTISLDTTALPTVDQTYGATSTNAQSGAAVASAISGKADSATTLAGYGITDGVTYAEIV